MTYEEVLRISKNVYENRDYLPHCYNSWCDEEDENGLRHNLVMVDEKEKDKVLGYQSYLFQGSKKNQVVAMALRMDDSLRGQGLGKAMMALCVEYLSGLDKNQEVNILNIVLKI